MITQVSAAIDPVIPPARRAGAGRWWRLVRLQPLGALGALLCLVIGALAIFGPYVVPYQPNAPSTQVQISPTAHHWFGTDNFGRDYFSRTVAGARTSIAVAGLAIAIGVSVGALLGMISANRAGWFDILFQRLVDTFLALPPLILAMFFVAVFGASLKNLVLVLSITVVPPVVRVSRGSALLVEQQPYMEAARIIGAPVPRLLLRHVLPNIAAPLLVILTTGIGALILAEAGLSFLGLGIHPPTAEWGQMLSASRPLAIQAPWLPIFPGAAISLAVLAFNLLGDALRDLWDPRLRSR